MMVRVTLNQLKRNIQYGDFHGNYRNLIMGRTDAIDTGDKTKLLKLAIIFVKYGDEYLEKLGYRIFIRYGNLFNDLKPLFDYTINKGYIPVTKFIENQLNGELLRSNSFYQTYFSAFQEIFRQNGGYYSFGQTSLIEFANETNENYVLIAPTSYGKSEIIIKEIYKNNDLKVCVIVPSKALLAQTKRRIVEHDSFGSEIQRIITHPEMYKGEESEFVAVLTQERLLRLLQRNRELSLDIILIDEAHNLFKDDNRSILLTQVLFILRKRNPDIVFKFYTPFIVDGSNLKSPYSQYDIKESRVDEFIKIERYFLCDLRGDQYLYLYDQFLNDFSRIGSSKYRSEIEILQQLKAKKNIAYINKPKDIESFAMRFQSVRARTVNTQLDEIVSAIGDYVHPEYNLIQCIKAGLVYHHGGMPEIVRLYVENIFSQNNQLEFIITSSTLLEGVNIPAEKIFLLTTKIGQRKFTKSQFKNLIGRVCRFSEIFNQNSGSLTMLEPEIILIKGQFSANNENQRKFLKDQARINVTIKDEVENILLEDDTENLNESQNEKLKDALEYIENIEPETVVTDESDEIQYASSDIGKLCFSNNVYDFDIIQNEPRLNRNLDLYLQSFPDLIGDPGSAIQAIYLIFIDGIEIEEPIVARLVNQAARSFYAMFLDWRVNGSSYRRMIAQFTSYWNSLSDPIIYVGTKWGEIKYSEDSFRDLYVDLSTKSAAQMINLAIVRIKEEQDYVDNSLMKYIEILNDLELIDSDFYAQLKYGSSDIRIISLLKNGFSLELAKLVLSPRYITYIDLNLETDTVSINHSIFDELEANNENKLLIFELHYHAK